MTYAAPRVTDFGNIELQTHTVAFGSPTNDVVDETPTALGTASSGSDGSGGVGGGFGLIGLVGGAIAALAGRDNGHEAVSGPSLLTDEDKGQKEK